MNRQDRHGTTRSVDVVSELGAMNIAIDYEVMRFGARTWGVRGHIAYDGDVLAAIFASEQEAWIALSPLRPTPHDPS